MKCDKLTLYHSKSLNLPIYVASEVDAAIAELKDKCQMHDFFWEGCGFAKRGFKNTIAVSEAFDKLEAENAELKQKLESVQASMYCDVVDANMENRRLKEERRWRKFPEEKPELGDVVLVKLSERVKGHYFPMDVVRWDSSYELGEIEVSHWMPLPSDPKEANK